MTRLWADPEWRAKKVAGQKGRKHTEEAKKKVADAKRLWWASRDTTETRRKIGLTSKGRAGLKGEKSPVWKGGRWVSKRDGYAYVHVPPGTPGAKKNGKGTSTYMLEHRWVMQQHLGRPLKKEEDVHHKNNVKGDNRLENLMLVLHERHFHEVECPHCAGKFFVK